MLPSSDFQVASSEVNRLPTLKELIGYQTNNYTSSPSPIFLSLFPLKAKNKEVLPREKDANSILEETTVRRNVISNDTERKSWMTNKHEKNEERSNTVQNDLDLSIDDIDAYYVDDNSAVDDDDTWSANKKRIDRQGPLTTTLRPTTMRGIPLADLLKSKVPRGFYVTRSETERSISEKMEDEALTTESTTWTTESNYNVSSVFTTDKIPPADKNRKMDSDLRNDDDEQNSKSSTTLLTFNTYLPTKNNRDVVRTTDRVNSATSLMDQEQTEKHVSSTPDFTEIESLEKDVTPSASSAVTVPIRSAPLTSTPSSPAEPESSIVAKFIGTTTEQSLTNDNTIVTSETTLIPVTQVQSNLVSRISVSESVTETESYAKNGTYSADLKETRGKVTYTDQDRRNEENSKLTSSLPTTTLPPTSVTELVEAPTTPTERVTVNKPNLRRQKTRFNPNYEFGRKSESRRYVSPSKKGEEESTEEIRRTQHPRRRIINYRKSERGRVVATTTTNNNSLVYEATTSATNSGDDVKAAEENPAKEQLRERIRTTGYVKKTKINNRVRNRNDRERWNKEETSVGKKLVAKTNQTGNKAVFKEEHPSIEENIDRFEPEVSLDFKFATLATR